jgi:hypothetical protein
VYEGADGGLTRNHAVGSRCGRFEPALHLLEHDIVSGGYDFRTDAIEPAPEAFERAARKGCMKVLMAG